MVFKSNRRDYYCCPLKTIVKPKKINLGGRGSKRDKGVGVIGRQFWAVGHWDRGWKKTLLDQRVFRIVLEDQE